MRYFALPIRGLSLRSKVFFLFAGAALLIVVPALVLIAQAVERRVYERATDELQSARGALASSWVSEDEVLFSEARVRAQDPAIIPALRSGDTLRVRRTLARRLGKGRVPVAVDSAGMPLLGPAPDSAFLQGAGSIIDVPPGGRFPVRTVLWQAWAEDGRLAGWVGVGTRLDSTVARRMKQSAAGADVLLFVGDVLVASTLPKSLVRSAPTIDRAAALQGKVWPVDLGGSRYLYAGYTLPTRGAPTSVLLLRPVAHELRIATGILRSLIGIGLAALVLSVILAGVVSRIVARPAQALVEASARLARGDYRAPLPRASADEIGQLARAFGEMRFAIAEREGRLRSAQAEMIHREKLAAMGRLVAQLSHEINNPIYNIQNCLEALERRGDPSDPNREFLVLAQEELTRMATLTRQLLDQSRPLADAATPLNLNALVSRVLTLASQEMNARAVRPVTELAADLPHVVVHPDAIQQVLANLLNNACDAMPGGGTLRMSTRVDGDVVEVIVEDTGVGIPEEHLSHIFEAFYTTKPGVQGVGLGLFVSEGIIRGHRGRLAVESKVGEGSRFTIRLPRETLDESLAHPHREPAHEAAAV